MTSLIEGDWQLIDCAPTQPGGAGYSLLFNLAEDPGAYTDLAALHPQRVQRRRERIANWLARGRAARPELVPTAQETLQLMREIGYIGDVEEPGSEGHAPPKRL